jgi:Fe-S cluster assembly protein SufD
MTAAPALRAPSRRTLQGFENIAADVAANANDPAWLAARRHAAAVRFAETGLPVSSDEEWRFTPLNEIAQHQFEVAGRSERVLPAQLAAHLAGPTSWPLIVLVDGVVDTSLSRIDALPAGVTFMSLAMAIKSGSQLVEQHLGAHVSIDATPFAAASMALLHDGALLHVSARTAVDQPIRVVHVTTAGAAHSVVSTRILVVLETGASATLLESYVDAGVDAPHLTNSCVEVVLGAAARLEHVRLQLEARTAWHVGFCTVDQQRDSHYRSFVLALGAKLSRHNLHARLNDTNIETLLYGLYIARDHQLTDNHTAIYHDHPNCNSWEVYKGVLSDHSHAVFNGKVLVQPEAQKTDAKQTNRNLLLSDTAKVDTKPQLEIFADDVKCTHGATIGRLDELQRYYLSTRGIAGREAEALLITAFVSEVVVEINQPELRSVVEGLVRRELDTLIP